MITSAVLFALTVWLVMAERSLRDDEAMVLAVARAALLSPTMIFASILVPAGLPGASANEMSET